MVYTGEMVNFSCVCGPFLNEAIVEAICSFMKIKLFGKNRICEMNRIEKWRSFIGM